MNKPIISIIAAIGENRELGRDNKLLWRIPEDLKRFRVLTEGHPIIMGRKTFESIGRPLPKRTNIIITRQADYKAEGCIVVGSVEAAIAKAKEFDEQEIFIIGGGEIYKQALPRVDKLYLTVVKDSQEADVYFPDYSEFTKIIKQENSHFTNYEVQYLELTR
ncbi:MAG: dihydrofolate reductase [Patescibacteria group bacterium]